MCWDIKYFLKNQVSRDENYNVWHEKYSRGNNGKLNITGQYISEVEDI